MGYRIKRGKRSKKNKTQQPFKGGIGKVRKWAVGMTICPRIRSDNGKDESTYTRCLDSMIEAGWEWAHLFCEPGTVLADRHSEFPATHREEKFGAWKNFLYGLEELSHTYPDVDAYCMFQDDIVFCKGTRQLMEEKLWPAEDCGVASIYMPSHYTINKTGWVKMDRSRALWGACAYIFPAKYVYACVYHDSIRSWSGHRNVDNVIGRWARHNKTPPYYFAPSLVQHIGEVSACWSLKNHASGRRAAGDFPGENVNVYLGIENGI